jgi:HK97 family phage major capsid protein
MGKTTIFRMKQQLSDLGKELQSITEKIREKVGDPGVKLEELRDLREQQSEFEERFSLLKDEIRRKEEEERSKVELQYRRDHPVLGKDDAEGRMIAAKADMIRSAILGRRMSEEARNLLGAIPAPNLSGGEKFLPTNLSNQLLSEPLTTNPLRETIEISNIKGLELPKIAYELDSDDFITDADTAKEIELTGDKVTFGRNKFKVKVRISDTVLHGSDIDLVTYVENALRSGLAAKEKKVSFAITPKVGEEHMSFYSSQNDIKEVEGSYLFEAITNAIADLHEDYRENAKVVMRYSDYVNMLKALANNSATLFSAPPESIIGKPVVFSDSAVTPIIGNFSFARLNYDGNFVYDSDKDVSSGEYLFVLTAWFDQHILLKSAFRLAKVTEVTP